MILESEPFKESQAQFDQLVGGLQRTLAPESPIEKTLVEKLAFLFLRMIRLYKEDAEVAPLIFGSVKDGLSSWDSGYTTESREEGEVVVPERTVSPDLLLRYEASIEKNIERTLNQLERLRALRLGERTLPPIKGSLSH
jgi:hypothetical protein